MDIMYDSIDSTEIGHQPERENQVNFIIMIIEDFLAKGLVQWVRQQNAEVWLFQVYYYFYYVLFIIVGAFFTLNLLVGVIVGTEGLI